MGTKVNSNYEDLLTFTRASKGHALRPVSYGDELVTNGTFDTDTTGWETQDSNISVASVDGEAKVTASSASTYIFASFSTKIGGIYKITADGRLGSNVTALNFNLRNNSHTGPYVTGSPQLTADGTLEFIFVAESTTTALRLVMFKSATPAVAYWDNVSVKEVTFDQPDGTLTLFEHPNNVPRVEYDADGNRLGLLVEEQRINLILNSSDFSASSWTKIGSSISAATNITAPDGTTNSFKLIESSSTGIHRVQGAPAAGGITSTMSCFMKKAERSWGNINFSGLGQGNVWFDLENGVLGTVQTAVTASIEDYGNGWYRCSVTGTPTSDAVTDIKVANADEAISYAGDGTSGIYVWGAQVEAGSFPTSYIKTTGSTATRSADVASIPVADFGYNQSEGTFFVEAEVFSTAITNAGDLALADAAGTPDMATGSRSGSSAEGYYSVWFRESNNTQAYLNEGPVITNNTTYKAAFCYKTNDFASSVDGNTVITDSSGTVPTRNDLLLIGSNYYGKLNGHIKSIKYYPRRLSDAQLQDLTS